MAVAQKSNKWKQIVTLEQSLESAKIFLHAAISGIAFLRDLYPDECFNRNADIVEAVKKGTYAEYANYVSSSDTEEDVNGICLLSRGRKLRVDEFLDKLEGSIFPEIQRGRLRAFHINISNKADAVSHVLESYTFTLGYSSTSSGGKMVSSIDLSDDDRNLFTVENVRHKLIQTLRRLPQAALAGLPILPDLKYINFRMTFNETWDGRVPLGFSKSRPEFFVASAEGWEKVDGSAPQVLDTGHHGVSLKFLGLRSKNSNLAEDDLLPPQLSFCVPVQQQLSIDEELEKKLIQERKESVISNRRSKSERKVSMKVVNKPRPTVPAAHHEIPVKMPTVEVAPHSASQMSTQAREDVAQRDGFHNMMASSLSIMNAGETLRVESELHKGNDLDLLSTSDKLIFASDVMNAIETRHGRFHFGVGIKSERDQVQTGDTMSCQCGLADDFQDSLQCRYCKKWQHATCYGYLHIADPRRPEDHVCYECLLHDEKGVLKEMDEMARLRQTARLFLQGPCSDSTLKNRLGCTNATASAAKNKLMKAGYLTKTKSGKGHMVTSLAASARQGLLNAVFDPRVKIMHLLVPSFAVQPVDSTFNTQFIAPPIAPPDTAPIEAHRTLRQLSRRQTRAQSRATGGPKPPPGTARMNGQVPDPSRTRIPGTPTLGKRGMAELEAPETPDSIRKSLHVVEDSMVPNMTPPVTRRPLTPSARRSVDTDTTEL